MTDCHGGVAQHIVDKLNLPQLRPGMAQAVRPHPQLASMKLVNLAAHSGSLMSSSSKGHTFRLLHHSMADCDSILPNPHSAFWSLSTASSTPVDKQHKEAKQLIRISTSSLACLACFNKLPTCSSIRNGRALQQCIGC